MTQGKTTEQEFQTQYLHGKYRLSKDCHVDIDVIVDPVGVKAAYEKAIKQVAKQVSLPGFRKGRAPSSIILQNYSTSVEKEWRGILLETSFRECVNQTHLFPVNQDRIDAKVVEAPSPTAAASLHFRFEAQPQVPSIDKNKISVQKQETPPVKEEEIQKVVGQIRLHYAEWEKDEGRPAKEGDYVTVDIVSLGQPENEQETSVVKDERIHMNVDVSSWLKDLLIGQVAGAVVEGENSLDQKADEEAKKAFTPGRFRITLKSIDVPRLPALDDDLAKKVGAENTEKLLQQIRNKLEREAKEALEQQYFQEIEKQLLQHYDFNLPSSIVESEKKYRLEKKRENQQERSTEEDSQKELEEIENETRTTLRLYYIARKYASEHHIHVSMQEIYLQMARTFHLTQQQLAHVMKNPKLIPEEVTGAIYSRLLIEKVKRHILNELLGQQAA